ncbi:MAG: hypothetical protein LBO62_03080 [Endomicrobium sp.]|jgi:3-deoxy-D-manno-octulosonic-acid transferase|nr:hypothetical protein [Endomicrobium sp.]
MIKLLLTIYNILFVLLLVPVSLLLLIFSSKYRREVFYKLPERFAFWFFSKDTSKKTVWIHCASLGEVRAVEPIINALKDDYCVVLTVLTKTGRQYAGKIESLRFVSLLPLDIYPLTLRAFKIIQPDIFVIVETELWPSTLYAAKKCGVKIITVNARMSEKSFKFYEKFRFFWRSFIGLIDLIAARNSSDAKRFAAFRGGEKNIFVNGNIKYDRDFRVDFKRSDFGLTACGIVFTAGSVRAEETQIIAQAYNEIKQKYPEVKFFLAPRHLAHLSKIKKTLEKNNIKYCFFSEIVKPAADDTAENDDAGHPTGVLGNVKLISGLQSGFILVDVFGELQNIYAVSDFSFVGGSLVNKGGQNPIEPAACGKPVLFGKYMSNFETEAQALLKSGGAFYVSNAKDIASKITEFVENKQAAISAGQNALKAVESQKGAVNITVKQIKSELGK